MIIRELRNICEVLIPRFSPSINHVLLRIDGSGLRRHIPSHDSTRLPIDPGLKKEISFDDTLIDRACIWRNPHPAEVQSSFLRRIQASSFNTEERWFTVRI